MNVMRPLGKPPRFRYALTWVYGIQRPAWDRLDQSETDEFDALFEKAAIGSGFDLRRISERERRRLESLVGKVGDVDLDGQRRMQAMVERLRDEEAMRVRRPFSKVETSNFFLTAFQALADEDIWIDDLQVMVAVLSLFAAGRTLAAGSHFEAEGDDLVLHYNNNYGILGAPSASGTFDGWQNRLKFLDEEGWLSIAGRGPQRTIRLGPKLKNALAAPATPVEAETAA
jgi:hypothetical protein